VNLDLRTIARALGGEITAGKVIAPAPGHSPRDRSLWVIPSHQAPNGYRVHCFSPKDDWREARDYVRDKLGLAPDAWRRCEKNRQIGDSTSRRQLAPCHASGQFGHTADHAARIARAMAIWDEAGDPRSTLAEVYLRSRGLDLSNDVAGAVVRFHPRCPWRDEERQQTIRVPALVACMRAIDVDSITAVHRTRLTPEGTKVDRRMLGIAAGSAIKIDPDDAVTIGLAIGEGIESCLAGRQLGFKPVWSLGSASAIAAFMVSPGIEALTILAERDDANARAIEACASRWHAAGREVVVVEPASGSDILDALRGAA